MKYKKSPNKTDKYTLREIKRQKRIDSLKGDGEYIFVNNTRGELMLNKPPIKGKNPVPQGQTFVGDSYFFNLMKTGEVRLIETIQPAVERNDMIEQKLILDQPERFTNKGATEHVVVPEDKKPLTEGQPQTKSNDKLLVEEPLGGVEIMLG